MVTVNVNPVCVGVDIGQISDPTAICVAEVARIDRGYKRLDYDYTVRHIERLALGTSYPQVAKRVADLLGGEILRVRKRLVRVDATGVGLPVVEMLIQEVRNRPETKEVVIEPLWFVHGEHYDPKNGKLGKAYLVSRLQALLQNGQVHAPETQEVLALLEELKVYEIKVSDDGKDTYGAFKTGTHDDLATALGLCCLPTAITGQELLADLKERKAEREKFVTKIGETFW